MKNNLLNRGYIVPILLGIIALLVIVGGIYFYKNKKVEAPIVDVPIQQDNMGILGNKEDLVSFSVEAGNTVGGVLDLSGSVKGGYFFEGNILIKLLDSNQNVLKSGFGTATTNWMTADPVSFTSSIDSTGLNGNGFILIQNDDPSDGEGGPAKKILVPVIFNNTNQKTMSVKVFFPNSAIDPGFMDCSVVRPTTRVIPYTLSTGEASLEELIKGPTAQELSQGFQTQIDSNTTIKSLSIKDGTAYVKFSKDIQNKNLGLCAGQFIVAQVRETLLQFPTIKKVDFSVEGLVGDFIQP